MKPEAQRIAIAVACGWKPQRCVDELDKGRNLILWWNNGNRVLHTDCLPDYFNDLNAMHEAEIKLDEMQAYNYAKQLRVFKDTDWGIVHATSSQRAEAFLRTIGKWVEE